MSSEGMSWDWRGQPDIDELDRIVANMTNCKIRVYKADTDMDEYGIVVTDEELTQEQVNERWEAWWRREG